MTRLQLMPPESVLVAINCTPLAPANLELYREHLRDRASPLHPSEGLPLEQDRTRHGVQAGRRRPEELAPPRRPQPVAYELVDVETSRNKAIQFLMTNA